MHRVTLRVWREPGWWVFELPEITTRSARDPHLTVAMRGQVAHLRDLNHEATALAAAFLDVTPDDIELTIQISWPADLEQAWVDVTKAEQRNREEANAVAARRDGLVRKLMNSGLNQADIAQLTGLSPQRVSQLVSRARALAHEPC